MSCRCLGHFNCIIYTYLDQLVDRGFFSIYLIIDSIKVALLWNYPVKTSPLST